ncbi:hypothetical protein ASE14_02880 [Agromyces sp. Root81]|uniref:hypothetical protein n=1 Tax=Agromyces sp. Root81 TaxID=1736601 RepID=UPI0006FC4F4B|nr:hypothetical protein [Agromyces sp. Root81]KRC62779.1 hypothetical protein ASE14_02880 [Agromyces sp. Root81]
MTGRRILILVIASIALIAGAAGVASTVSQSSRSPFVAGGEAGTLGDAAAPERADDAGEGAPPSGEPVDGGGLPPVESEVTAPPAVERPAEPASEVGGRVEGFPELIPIVDGSRIVSSAVTADGGRLQATLVAEASVAPEEVLASYRRDFAMLAFAPVEAPSVGGSTALTFTNGTDSVLVTVTGSATGGTTYSVFGMFDVGSEG